MSEEFTEREIEKLKERIENLEKFYENHLIKLHLITDKNKLFIEGLV